MSQLVFDDDVAAKIEQLNRARDVVRRRQLLRTALDPKPGERILDVGCGPGVYVAELLAEVGPSGTVAGVDASPQMLAIAERRCEGHGNATFHEADVGSLPFSDAEFDAAFTVQVLEYVADIGAALDELHRVVRVGGRVVVWDTDWSTVSWHSSDPARMARVLAAWDEHLVDPSLPRTLAPRLRAAGFDDVHAIGHPFVSTEDSPDVMGGAIIPLIRDYVPGHGGVSAAEVEAWSADLHELSHSGEFFMAYVQFCFHATRGS
jgi:arsenite methyltransferase